MLKYLVEQKIMSGHERNPMAGLAAYLSAWREEFESDGKGNFSLRKMTQRSTAQEAPLSH